MTKAAVYTTKEIADEIGIHVNTVRFYEKIGFITKPKRLKNGWREYSGIQLEQCRFVRLAMRAEVLQGGLRKKAVETVRLCAGLDFEKALLSAKEYLLMIDREIQNAESAAAFAQKGFSKENSGGETLVKRQNAAKALGVTVETLRTWERSGLVQPKRAENGRLTYSSGDMQRLLVIRTLRCANYSLSAILRLLNQVDGKSEKSALEILNTPTEDEDIVSVCDRLIVSLQKTRSAAEELIIMLENMKEKF